jgi:hypothetical protein
MEEQYKGLVQAADRLLSIASQLKRVLGETDVVNELNAIRMSLFDELEKIE